MNFNVTLSSTTDLSRQEILQNIMQFSHFKKLEHQLRFVMFFLNQTNIKIVIEKKLLVGTVIERSYSKICFDFFFQNFNSL